jgi:hypothetical protein
MAVVLQPHQAAVLDKLGHGKVLTGGVGTGKTVTSLAYIWTKEMGGTLNDLGSLKNPVDIYVMTTARKRDSLDWQIWAARFAINEDPSISVNGIKITVDSYNNIDKYKDVKNAFFILDEQRMVGNGAWTKAFLRIALFNRWIMLSATPGDKWEDYIPLFIANGFYKNRTQFTREHCVYSHYGPYPKLERYNAVNKLVKLKHQIIVEMPYERHTKRHICEIIVPYDKVLFERVVKDRWHVYEDRPLKDVAELFATMRKVVNSDSSRIEELRSLMQKHPRLIVYYNFDYELEILRSLAGSHTSQGSSTSSSRSSSSGTKSSRNERRIPTSVSPKDATDKTQTASTDFQLAEWNGRQSAPIPTVTEKSVTTPFVLAEWNGHKHEAVPTTESWLYLVQYAAGAEAWNCTTTDAMAFYSLTYSYKYFHQSQGRIDRLDTPFVDLWYYVLLSQSAIDRGISGSLKNKKDFNEKKFLT